MKKRKIIALLCALVFCVGVFAGCVQDSQEIFSVNGEKVTRGKFMFFLENMKEMIAEESNLDIKDASSWETAEIENKKAIDVAKENALNDVVSLMVQVQKAKEEGITLSNDDKKAIG